MISNKNTQTTKALVILGPTSSGKSAVAIRLAKKFSAEVISADSRQVYRDMNLGTGKIEGKWTPKQKPTKAKLSKNSLALKPPPKKHLFVSEEIVHHLIDFRSPRWQYNVANFQKDCQRKISEIIKRKNLPIICGGTGFWISAAVDGTIFPQVPPDPVLRKKLQDQTAQALFEKLKKLDHRRAKTIDKHNKVRLIRAIEICQALGKVPKPAINYKLQTINYKLVGLDWPQEILDQKIKKRLESRWTEGMIEEVKDLRQKYSLSWKKIQSFGLAYFWIPLFLQGKISKRELKEKVFIAERGYAKRQRTWFKRDKRIVWENDPKKIEALVKKFLQ